ncbi:MAG: hypothetical protein KJZ86_20785 [Caldilineaceae bacterium]|nr:hypothetical protein [Caldilineaceae bacterium]HRJ42882.1 hypothetical protein [Caldilineaceae bacterium]
MISGAIRDIAIIFVALEILILNALLIVLVWQVWRLVKMIQTEVKPIIQDTQETVGTVRGTADFVSANVVEPVVKTSSKLAGWRRTASVLRSEVQATVAQVNPSARKRTGTSSPPPPTP